MRKSDNPQAFKDAGDMTSSVSTQRPKKQKRKTNVQVVREIMEFSQFGFLGQMFVIDALTKHAERVAASKPEDYPPNYFICPEAWIGVAKEIKRKMDEHYTVMKGAKDEKNNVSSVVD